MVNINRLIRSFKFALRGISFVWRGQNFRIQFFIGLLVFIMMYVLGLSRLEKVALILVITSVLILESLNTIFEHLSDILKPRLHDYIMIIKDIMAAVVLLASIASVLVGIMVFWPYVF